MSDMNAGKFEWGELAKVRVVVHDFLDTESGPHPSKTPFVFEIQAPDGTWLRIATKGIKLVGDGPMLVAEIRIPLSEITNGELLIAKNLEGRDKLGMSQSALDAEACDEDD